MKKFISENLIFDFREGGKPYPAFEKNGKTVPGGISKEKIVLQNQYGELQLTRAEMDGLVNEWELTKDAKKS